MIQYDNCLTNELNYKYIETDILYKYIFNLTKKLQF